MADETRPAPLTALPAELLEQIVSYLTPVHIAKISQTCRALNKIGGDDRIWRDVINGFLPSPLHEPYPSKSFRELYAVHHPHWFLVKNPLWFSNSDPCGKLILTHYNAESGSIEARALASKRGEHLLIPWEKDDTVSIHSFSPSTSLDMLMPTLLLEPSSPRVNNPDDEDDTHGWTYDQQVMMRITYRNDPCAKSSMLLCRKLSSEDMSGDSQVWPPLRFPSSSRTRPQTRDMQRARHPTKLSEVSESNFQLRTWAEYYGSNARATAPRYMSMPFLRNGGFRGSGFHGAPLNPRVIQEMRTPENLRQWTFATLQESDYMPTPEKPWQGIWVGDYSGHGCEYILIRQPDEASQDPLPEGMDWLAEWFAGMPRRLSSDSEVSNMSFVSAEEDLDRPNTSSSATQSRAPPTAAASSAVPQPGPSFATIGHALQGADATQMLNGFIEIPYERTIQEMTDVENAPSGRLEAIKLTGDLNVPRGEYTFIAPDIGHGGFIRVADEEIFRHARIVRSAGHIAAEGFQDDQYSPSQLIMISHDRLAQFWEGFGHISYFQRVHLDALKAQFTS